MTTASSSACATEKTPMATPTQPIAALRNPCSILSDRSDYMIHPATHQSGEHTSLQRRRPRATYAAASSSQLSQVTMDRAWPHRPARTVSLDDDLAFESVR